MIWLFGAQEALQIILKNTPKAVSCTKNTAIHVAVLPGIQRELPGFFC